LNAIECEGITKKYGNLTAINNISVAVGENEITGLIGRNGAGKTTFLKLVAGFLRPDSGKIRVFSENPFNNLKVSANMVFVDDRMQYPAALSIKEILDHAGKLYARWDEKLAIRLMNYFSLSPGKSYRSLSKGMQSTFNMIIGIASRCALTIFDEPTTGMDAAVRKDFYRVLLKDYVNCPRTIIMSSHLLSEIEEILEKIILIDEGKLYLHMPVLDLKEYAIGIRGPAEKVNALIFEEKIIHRETYGLNSVYAVARRTDIAKKRMDGVEYLPVNTDDLCIYLTDKSEGGIDDVFS
jgi:ABC-2 type transport system ATP-binding protein